MDNEISMATNEQLLDELYRRYATLVVFGHNDDESAANPTFSLVRGSQFAVYGGLAQLMYEARLRMKGKLANDELDD
ncbi:hypothetical protein UFOVP184_22 [uncultured Caudovirales phage]|uniref:Uncharacterized protein n=1 Tax=uncultured Caudovirales phage TaxID=2100421 RepID=A0A6J7WCH9_9CAUD|nr:hypothetical protein UFOVP184_22 [uncultured Caudovirales phage]